MNQFITGNLKLEIDDPTLEARLTFTPDPEGTEWKSEKILDLLNEKGIKEGIDLDALDEFLSSSSAERKSKEPFSFIIARGTAPVDARPARLKIEHLSIPEELQKDAAALVNQDTPPLVYEWEVQKVETEQVVRKKSGLPFLSDREERKTKWNKKVNKRPVQVSSKELGRGYAKAGDLIAWISPAVKSKKGINLFGQELPAGAGAAEGIYLGEGLKEYGIEIIAEKRGFFRYGPNWIELLPFTPHEFSVFLEEDGSTCRLNFTPGSSAVPLPDPEVILERCHELGAAPHTLLKPEELRKIIEQAAALNKPLKARTISQSEYAEIRLTISEDKLKAVLYLKKSRGAGRPLSFEAISRSIRQSGLKGMDTERIRKDIINFYNGPERSLENYFLVEGRDPTDGNDGSITWLVSFVDQEKLNQYKEQVQTRSEQLKELKSLEEFPVARIEALARVGPRAKVVEIEPATAGEPGVDVYGTILPGINGREPQFKLYENVQRIKNEIVTLCEGVLEKGSQDDAICLRAHPHQDCEIKVEISGDRMRAFLTIFPHISTGAPVLAEDVHKEIEKLGIVKGIDEAVLEESIRKAQGGEKLSMVLFARGKPTQHGKYLSLDFKIARASGRSVTITEEGKADYKTQDKITIVQKDTLLAELPPPAQAQDGWDIFGKVIQAKEALPQPLQVGKNVERREETDGSVKFFAKISGRLYYDGNQIDVLYVHTIDGDVGLKTGNVKFSGSVRVKGSVQSGFHIMAGGSIMIDETIQGALLSAEENILAQKGVVGEGRAVLRARKDIKIYFAEQALLLSVGDINIKNASLRCQIKCNGKLSMMTDKGHIVGGQVRAKYGLEAMNLGSEGEAKTEIHFGQDYMLGDRIEIEQKKVQNLRTKIQELDSELKRLGRTINPDRTALEKIRKEKLYNMKIMEKHTHRLFNLRERFEQHFDSEVVAKGTVFPGVILESHGRKLVIKSKSQGCVFTFNSISGKIEEKPLKK